METEYDYLFKIVLIGDAGVGKTSIVRRYTDGIFTSAGIPTIGVDFCIKTLQIGSSAVKVIAVLASGCVLRFTSPISSRFGILLARSASELLLKATTEVQMR